MKDSRLSLTAFDWVPDFAQGHVRDLRVRWALEEAGFPYEVDIVSQGAQRQPAHLKRHPFGQIPTLEIDGRAMFESGAIVWRIAEASENLLPKDPAERDRVLTWIFAALNTLEPPVGMLAMLELFVKDKDAASRLRPEFAAFAKERLQQLATVLEDRLHVAGEFSAADILLTTVLRDVPEDLIAELPTLRAYMERHTTRPAFVAAMEGQMKPFIENAAQYG